MGKKEQKAPPARVIPPPLHGLFGGTAGALGICVVQPMDMIKTRMQLLGAQGKKGNVFEVTRAIIKKDGFTSLWHGLSCSVFRQYTYGMTRFFVFYNLFEAFSKIGFSENRNVGPMKTKRKPHFTFFVNVMDALGNPAKTVFFKAVWKRLSSHSRLTTNTTRHYGRPPNAAQKGGLGMIAGAFGAVVGNPAEVALIRMTAEGSLSPEKKKGYTSVFNAIARIIREEGLKTLWTGVEATVTRAMIVSAAELGSYTQAREIFVEHLGDGIQTHFAASMVAGLIATAVSLPVDIIKTRVQNAPGGQASQISVLKDILKNEGVKTLWSGFLPTYMKLGPHAVLTFVIFEQFFILYWKIMG